MAGSWHQPEPRASEKGRSARAVPNQLSGSEHRPADKKTLTLRGGWLLVVTAFMRSGNRLKPITTSGRFISVTAKAKRGLVP